MLKQWKEKNSCPIEKVEPIPLPIELSSLSSFDRKKGI